MKSTSAVAASAFASGAAASIISIQVPETIAVGRSIPVKLVNNIDQSSTYQTSITFGLGINPKAPSTVIGTPVSSIYLQDGTMPAAPFTRNMTVPDWTWGRKGKVGLRAAIFGAYGATGGIGTKVYSANVTVGDDISDNYVELQFIE
ncbi:hypothetical protein ISF_08379 [Cordyceps fumosorosea ARSEF 2679]|uniref:Uncharacterized protein n=1 Tax=Cordyceps fumosorosea (strain ARSEF 2679) TaxID=1081104 RepID=A0A167MK08_CORFA|nr:hypothetical protein ISF_08379 [Cordyceps fumosorosea ARSEF 2679]OAA54451.1 hypothetical protein ISF_08379 [Cordyceps fumosorosea ARSEF 2679]